MEMRSKLGVPSWLRVETLDLRLELEKWRC
jgi:hypothetical protein